MTRHSASAEQVADVRCTPAACCFKCHFLMKWTRTSDGKEWKSELSREQRVQLASTQSADGVLGVDWSPACYQDVWDWANRRTDSWNELRQVLTHDRCDKCFFYAHTPGMFFPAAAELERREANRREARRDRRVAKWGVVIAAASVGVGAVAGAIFTKVFG